ncbi:MAG: glycoside hydrolase domain-containing protein [Smithella sp.]|jgi:hypothetical protein
MRFFIKISLILIIVVSFTKTAICEGVSIIAETSGYTVWWAYSGERITPKSTAPLQKDTGIHLCLAKNEIEPFQLVVLSKKAATINVKPGGADDGLNLQVYSVRSVKTQKYGPIPDILEEDGTQQVREKENAVYWIKIKSSPTTRAGDHEAFLYINGTKKIKLKITVLNFVLPQRRTMHTVARVWWKKEMEQNISLSEFYENLSEHLILNAGTVLPGPAVVFDKYQKKISIDFTAFDRQADYLFSKLGYEGIFVPYFFGGASGLVSNKWLNEIPVMSAEFEKYYGDYSAQLTEHLRKKGWLDKTYIQAWDEPQPKDYDTVLEILRIIRKNAPQLKIYLASIPVKEFEGFVDAWCIPLREKYFDPAWPAWIKSRKTKGEKIYGYQNYIEKYAAPPLHMRLLPWEAKKYGLYGIEWWSVNHWAQYYGKDNPFLEGSGILIHQPNGSTKKPLNSIRWELYSKGLEDAEYLTILENKGGGEKISQIINQVVFGVDAERKTNDPHLVEQLRLQMGKQIEKILE